MKPLVVLSSRDRFARANNQVLCGPSADFLAEAIGGDFDITDDLDYHPDAVGRNVILCGNQAVAKWRGYSEDMDKLRGYLFTSRASNVVCTFDAIQCSEAFDGEYAEQDDEIEADNDGKNLSRTSRANYRFWAMSDIAKLLRGERRDTYAEDIIWNADLSGYLDSFKEGELLFIDIETWPNASVVQCLAISRETGPVYSIPIYDHIGALQQSPRFFASLARAFRKCIIVGHNISFDLGFLAMFHGIPWGPRFRDTMIQHHRIFPESEKSLGHVISYWINAPYHKDAAGTWYPRNHHQYQQLLRYNALDVLATRAVYLAQRRYIEARPNLLRSIDSANRSLEIYLRAGFTGFEFNENSRSLKLRQLETKIRGLTRVFQMLAGSPVLVSSPEQLGEYFFSKLGLTSSYQTDGGANSTAADAMYALAVKNPKVVSIRVLLELREVMKCRDVLKFSPYYRIEER
jgi:hypothetical protein